MSLASAAPLSLPTPRTPVVQIFFLSFLLIIPPPFRQLLFTLQINSTCPPKSTSVRPPTTGHRCRRVWFWVSHVLTFATMHQLALLLVLTLA